MERAFVFLPLLSVSAVNGKGYGSSHGAPLKHKSSISDKNALAIVVLTFQAKFPLQLD
jgi:hypothetical protein